MGVPFVLSLGVAFQGRLRHVFGLSAPLLWVGQYYREFG